MVSCGKGSTGRKPSRDPAEEAAEEAIDAMEPEEAQVQTVQTAPEVT